MLFDTHCHLYDAAYDADRPAVLERACAAGIGRMLCPATDRQSSEACVELARHYDGIYAAVGIHPQEAGRVQPGDIEAIRRMAEQEPAVVAIGEVGLDYHYDTPARDTQKEIFIEMIGLARDLDLPIDIHDREAHGDTMEILRRYGKGLRGVFHCYSGSLEMTTELIRMGFYFGFTGTVVFPNSKRAKQVASRIPMERLLIETDSPYLTPPPYRGRRNEPAYVRYVAEEIARLRGLDVEYVTSQTMANGLQVFGIAEDV
ncbi:TatD family hydrolase [uncultured Megasphaera sp.]|uniref:TatD family hydrolase n=1 Tax=uncultured Megasphaera sp. TaxID=165188 RepID=UPI003784CAC0